MELCASAKDQSQVIVYENTFRTCHRDNSLIVPNEQDWLLASKVLYWLSQGRRRSGGGTLAQLAPGVTQRLALDALIATSAHRWNAAVVTDNWKEFSAIKRFCNVKILKAADFFK